MSMILGILLTMLTTLSEGMFHTTYETKVDSSVSVCNQVVDSMIYYLQTNPELLSKKFFVGLGKQEDKKKNAFYLIWKESTYVPEEQYSRLVLDVLVDEKPFMKNVVIESSVVDTMAGDRRDVRVDIHYAGTLIKQAYGTFHIEPSGDGAKLAMDVHVKFGWFFRIFISRKVYSETIDWRLVRFVENLKLISEGITLTEEYWAEQDAAMVEP